MAESKEARNKALVLKAFDTLFNKPAPCFRSIAIQPTKYLSKTQLLLNCAIYKGDLSLSQSGLAVVSAMPSLHDSGSREVEL
jgi:hypothetical protein